MNNKERQARTGAESSTKDKVTTSSPNSSNTNVGCQGGKILETHF